MRVLHVAQPLSAGVPGVVAGLAADQLGRGWEVHIAHPSGSILAASCPEASHHVWEAVRAPGPGTITEARALRGVLAQIEPDLVHLHSAKAGLAGRAVIRGRLPTIFQPHAWSFDALSGPLSAAARVWERRAGRWSDVILCVGRYEKERGVAAGIHAPWEVVPNGVDLRRWKEPGATERSEARVRLGLVADAPVAVCVGRLSEQKGQDVLLHAWRTVHSRVPGAQLVVVGDGDLRPDLERMQVAQVMFAGDVPDPRDHYLAADLAVVASRWEGMSLAMLEAMANGRPVVTTAVPGAEVVVSAAAGAVVDVEDAEALASAITGYLQDPDKRRAEGRKARRAVEEGHDRARVNDRIAAIYGSVLTRRGR